MRAQLDRLLREALQNVAAQPGMAAVASLDARTERTRDQRHGDFTTNVAMQAAKAVGQNPRALATQIMDCIPASPLIDRVQIAGPGFINFTLSAAAYRDELRQIATGGDAYGRAPEASGRKVLIEYVSANPTGPLHVGHGRHAAYGASLANILRAAGHAVAEEYYVNDAGRQMDILAASVWLRYAEQNGRKAAFPGNAYQGSYVRDIARALQESHGDALLGDADAVLAEVQGIGGDAPDEKRLDQLIGAIKRWAGEQTFALVLDAALASVLGDIRDDLAEFGVVPQRWYSERSLTEGGAVDRALDLLGQRGMLYQQDGATWFRSTAFGDDKDRVVVRENGARTYFASDIAYHLEKCDRGYDLLLNVLGADHHGYVTRVRAGLEALGKPADVLEVRLVQFVVLYRGQAKAQMSTRSGEYVTLRELREEVGNDAARFFYVSRSNEQHLEFDLELAKSQSNDNPVYYVQYAHARIASMLRRMQEEGFAAPRADTIPLDGLTTPEEHAVMVALSRYPEIVALAAEQRAPQHVVHYLRELAGAFHTSYNAHRILVDDQGVRDARVVLAVAAQQVIRSALTLLGVSAPVNM